MKMKTLNFIDLFCGLGGIRIGFQNAIVKNKFKSKCLLSSDIKKSAVNTYKINFKDNVVGDVCTIETKNLPSFDVLLAGFPCQAFSSAGKRMGFEDTRGTLFFEVARILKDKQPQGFILENVEGLIGHDNGKTLSVILATLVEIGYNTSWKLLNSKDFGLAQNRKRIYIVGTKKDLNINTEDVFNFKTNFKNTLFKDVRDFKIPVIDSKLNKLLNNNFDDLSLLSGKSIKDKRGGVNNIHSWDLGLKGRVTKKQKELINSLITKRRYKKWAVENGTAWFDGIPLSLIQIKSFIDYPTIQDDLDALLKKGYLKMDYPKDYSNINGVKTKIPRTDLPMGYTLTTGKLSFEFSDILDDNDIVPTIVATDASRLGVIEKDGLRKLTTNELKKLFGFPVSYKTEHLTEEECFDLFGNSVTVNVVESVANNLIKLLKY